MPSKTNKQTGQTAEWHWEKAHECEGMADAARGVGALLDAQSYAETAERHRQRAREAERGE